MSSCFSKIAARFVSAVQGLIKKYMSLLFEEIALSSKLELYHANQDQIRNQRPRLRRNTLFLGRKAGVGVK